MPIATISSKNQITLPARVLSHLGLKSKDRVMVSEVNGEIRIRRVPSIWEFAGKIKGRGLTIAQEKKAMMKAVADHVLGREK